MGKWTILLCPLYVGEGGLGRLPPYFSDVVRGCCISLRVDVGALCLFCGPQVILQMSNCLMGINVGCYLLQQGLKISAEHTEVSLWGLKEGRYWLMVTASFFHADASHVVNNMIMMAAYAPELQHRIGSFGMVMAYVLTGWGGWLLTLLWSKYKYKDMADYVWSCGSSPCTYGLNLMLLCLAPFERVCTVPRLPVWLWLWLLWDVPSLLREPKLLRAWGLVSLIVTILYGHLFSDADMSCAVWFVQYLVKVMLLRLHTLAFNPGAPQSSDHAAHFGGALVGLLLSYCYTDGCLGISHSSTECQFRTAMVSGVCSWLFARLVLDF